MQASNHRLGVDEAPRHCTQSGAEGASPPPGCAQAKSRCHLCRAFAAHRRLCCSEVKGAAVMRGLSFCVRGLFSRAVCCLDGSVPRIVKVWGSGLSTIETCCQDMCYVIT